MKAKFLSVKCCFRNTCLHASKGFKSSTIPFGSSEFADGLSYDVARALATIGRLFFSAFDEENTFSLSRQFIEIS